MKKILCPVICILLICTAFAGCSKSQYTYEQSSNAADLTIVTFNCAAPWGNALKSTGSGARVKRFAAYMNAVKPDSFGTQEMNSSWQKKLAKLLPDYESYGVKRGGDDNEKKSEMNSIFWMKDKYICLEQSTFWLSETPDTESKYDGAGCYRVCSYVVLQSKENDKIYVHLNTHLDNSSDEARVFGANVIIEKINDIKGKYSDALIVLTGDFNDIETGAPCTEIAKTLTSCSVASPQNKSITYTDWGNIEDTSNEPIDFIFTNGTPTGYDILDDISNGYVSDHYGVISTIRF